MKALFAACAISVISTASIAEDIAKDSCEKSISITAGSIIYIWNSDKRDEFFNKQTPISNDLGGALFYMLIKLKSDKIMRNMPDEEFYKIAMSICLNIYRPYFKYYKIYGDR